MMSGLGIRQKLFLVFVSITIVGGLALFLRAGLQLQDATVEFFQRDLEAGALTAANALVEVLEHVREGEDSYAELQALLQRYAHHEWAFTLMDTDLRVLASTYTPRYPILTQLPETPEVRAALNGTSGRTVRTDENGEDRAYVAVPVSYEGETIGVLRASSLMAPAYEEAERGWWQLAGAMLPILVLVIAASFWFGRTLTRPLQQLSRSAMRIAEGVLDERVTVESEDELGQLGHAFNFMAERINGLLTAQRSFVSNAAHELRTPLMTLKLRIDALQNETLPEAQRATYLKEAAAEVDRMAMLINQLLALARLDEDRHQADDPPEDSAAFFRDAARNWHIRARERGVDFQAEIPTTLPSAAIAASDLHIILDNLLSNALKYTPSGGRVRLQVVADSDSLQLTISDTGQGFDAEAAERLFERFFRAEDARRQHIPGTGLGLSIVNAVLERCNGAITAKSDGPGQGAVFEVRLPLSN